MSVRWFIQKSTFPRSEEARLNRLIFTLKEQDCEVLVGDYRPFGAMTYDFFEPSAATGEPTVLFGSIAMLKDYQRRGDNVLGQGCWMPLGELTCQHYYSQLGDKLLQEVYGFYPFRELKRLKDFLFAVYSEPGDTPSLGRLLFIRPDDNEKSFCGEVVGERNFNVWYESVAGTIPWETLCVVAPFREIKREWRLIMNRHDAVTGSLYKVTDHLVVEAGCPPSVTKFAYDVACKLPNPLPVWVLDIAEVATGELRVAEMGSVNCAGFYECDVQKMVRVINKEACKECFHGSLV